MLHQDFWVSILQAFNLVSRKKNPGKSLLTKDFRTFLIKKSELTFTPLSIIQISVSPWKLEPTQDMKPGSIVLQSCWNNIYCFTVIKTPTATIAATEIKHGLVDGDKIFPLVVIQTPWTLTSFLIWFAFILWSLHFLRNLHFQYTFKTSFNSSLKYT